MAAEGILSTPATAFAQHRVLLLNADYRPLGFPLLVLNAQQVVSALLLERVQVVRPSAVVARSPSFELALPSVVALKHYVNLPGLNAVPACTRHNLFVRDRGVCLYTGRPLILRAAAPGQTGAKAGLKQPKTKSASVSGKPAVATIDHVLPTSRGGAHSWQNCVLSSMQANILKGNRTPQEAGMTLVHAPWQPTAADLLTLWLTESRLHGLDAAWLEFLTLPPSIRAQRALESLASAA